MKKLIAILLTIVLLTTGAAASGSLEDTEAENDAAQDAAAVDAAVFESDGEEACTEADLIDIPAPYAILMDEETGTVLYEKNADEQRLPASVTKVMTLLLIAEAIDAGTISFDDMVSVSAYAASMGGSQVYLEEGEKMSVRELLKCIIVVSANDATVAMAEAVAGTEEAFVERMNARAAELGMKNTHFTNCTGLWDDATHVTTARDIAIMSRELLRHTWIREYTTIWMDTVRNGEFGLSNTNKLIYYYDGATGLKTGFTGDAGYCLSAAAEREGVEYIAVVLGCETSDDRFQSAKTLLNFAFANFTLYNAVPESVLKPIAVRLGTETYAQPVIDGSTKLLVRKSAVSSLECSTEVTESVTAPVSAGAQVGTFTVSDGGKKLLEVPIILQDAVGRLSWWDIFQILAGTMFGMEKAEE